MFFKTSVLLLSLSPAITSAGLLPGWLVARRDSNMCGVKGRADTDNNYFYSGSKTLASYAGCSARCAVQKRCKSFGYDDSVCVLFDEPLTGNFKANSRSGLTFYDVGCTNATASVTLLPSTSTSHKPHATTLRTSATASVTLLPSTSTSHKSHATTLRTTKTRTTQVPVATVTGTSSSEDTGSDDTEDGSDDSDDTDSPTESTTSAVGTLITLVPTSTAEATTDVDGGETATATLDSTSIATATGASGSLSTNGSSFGNGTTLNATVSDTPPFLNTTSISGTNSTNSTS